MNMKGSQKSTTEASNNPPAWAAPLFQTAAADALKLYQSGQGFNTYRGPTVAHFSPQSLEGLNRTMMMTGSTGPKITNESVFETDQIKQIRAMIAKQMSDDAARKAAAAAAATKPDTGRSNQDARLYDEHGNRLPAGMAGYMRPGNAGRGSR